MAHKLAYILIVAAVVSAAFAQPTLGDVARCAKNHNNCAACTAEPGCGFCGVFNSEGWCIPGNASSSSIAQFGFDECPAFIWKFGSQSCDAVVRVVVPMTSQADKVVWGTYSVQPDQQSQNAMYDALLYVISTERGDDNETRGGFGVLYGTGMIGHNISNWSFHGVAFDSILEYHNSDNSAFRCTSVSATQPSDCDDFVNVRNLFKLRQWNPVTGVETPGADGATTFTGSASTTDGVFSFTCVTSNAPFVYEGNNYSPYEIKCDVDIRNYQFVDSGAQLSLATVIASASADVTPSATTTSLELGSLGVFEWTAKADIVDSSGTPSGRQADIVRTNVLLKDQQSSWAPGTSVFVTLFSFTNAAGERSLTWDPNLGINAANQYDVNTGDGSNNTSNVAALLVSVLAVCVSVLLAVFA